MSYEYPLASFLVLDFLKEKESRECLESIQKYALFPHQTIYLDNGGFDLEYPNQLYKDGLFDVLIRKKKGFGGGYGQTDLIRYCPTEFFFFVQNDQKLVQYLTLDHLNYFINLLNHGYHCIDLNGDQSGKGIWTDRAHFMRTSVFNSLSPFPNGGPGLDHIKWNEQFLQEKFKSLNYKIAHLSPTSFVDCGKWSIREAGDGLYKHRTDTKILFIQKTPTYKTDVFPPFDEQDWELALSGKWPSEGKIPNLWQNNSFTIWND